MKRFTLSVVMTGILGLAAYTFSGAQPPARGPERPGPRGGGGPGGGRGELALLRAANLTDDQKAAIKEIREAEKPAADEPGAEGQLRRQLETEVYADAPDTGKIASLQQQLAELQAVRLARQIGIEQRIAQVLTNEQRAKVRERLAQGPPDRRGGGRPGGRPPRE